MGRPKKIKVEESKSEQETPEKLLTESTDLANVSAKLQPLAANDDRLNNSVKLKRDDLGLLVAQEYKFKEDGSVDWRAMIKPEYLVPNAQKYDDGVDLKAIDVTSQPDSKLLILLGGIKELAQLRGFSKVEFYIKAATMDYAAVTCEITWIPNFESSNEPVVFSSLADAHLNNTQSFAKDFLVAIAENRAFTRAVRNFLKVNITGKEEIGEFKTAAEAKEEEGEKNPSPISPAYVLKAAREKKGLSFESIKNKYVKEGFEGAEDWNSESDIPKTKLFEIIERVNKAIVKPAA